MSYRKDVEISLARDTTIAVMLAKFEKRICTTNYVFKITISAVYSFFSKYKFATNVLQFHVYFPAGLKFLYHNRDNNCVVSHWSVLTKFRKVLYI